MHNYFQIILLLYYYYFSPIVSGHSLVLEIKTDSCKGTDTEVNYLEHVQAVITANASRRGDLELFLTSPMGTRLMIFSNDIQLIY